MKVEINTEIKELFISEYLKSLPFETGGILFGYYSNNFETAVVTDAFYGIPDSQSHSRSFKRGTRGFNKFSEKMWKQKKFYLGEWHTHPMSLPEMSLQDKRQMLEIKNSLKYNCDTPMLIIIGEIEKRIQSSIYIFSDNNILKETSSLG
ncbi:Mov34/MPN/PAD-1 family protein [Lactococcus lactis]|uniref:Mov34/MPN/PAD-1 family protein n=1 Tax=Lactococcus TaxID=1357 RepID=UPI0025A1AD08|nr:Mov34/MPN/PAD-1 family protein [Lactococcus lactis]MDM7659358.1 Mov34/MPN/PAD-1 family protein [Lactococcus lactis]MDQ7172557.1 Mov34/MPN/PAD-1 family protein [Lactococcus lactis]WMM05783.1 Mov34/MPN/PAD-1 family protein [Lactococcus lactis]WMM20426.1 Mov34/MPN/PAD-1 family protein [Lactococcus lactis]WMM21668.1 Mov34/MPN/PAD-1 family protein [Lactococcus lactis]